MHRTTPARSLLVLLSLLLFTSCTEGSFVEPGSELNSDIQFSLSPVGVEISVGETTLVNATIANANGKAVNPQSLKWESSNAAVATVDGDGRVTGASPGEATITAWSGQRVDEILVTVTSSEPLYGGIRISPQALELAWINATGDMTAQVYDLNGALVAPPGVRWMSLDPDIAEVDSVGKVVARSVGTAMIVATCATCGVPDTSYATVQQVVDRVVVTPSGASLAPGSTLQLQAYAEDKGGTRIPGSSFVWGSNSLSVAKVSQSGLLEAVADGIATVNATTSSKSGLASFTVGNGGESPTGDPNFTEAYQKWNDNFVRYGDLHWSYEQSNPGAGLNYYDRASFWYRRGLANRGDFTLKHYLSGMVWNGGPDDLDGSMAPRNWAAEGVLMAWERAGRPSIVKGQNVGWAAFSMCDEIVADWVYSENGSKRVNGDDPDGLWEGRISERALLGSLLPIIYDLPGKPRSAASWEESARYTLELILRAQEPDGSWPHPKVHESGTYQINYMVAVLLDALTRYYNEFEQDPRIPEAVVKSVDYLWGQWTGVGFPYYDNNDPNGDPDLNLLFVSAWGFAHQVTGDDRYRQQGDRIFAEGVNRAWINQTGAVKQFNQQYRSAHRYIERTR